MEYEEMMQKEYKSGDWDGMLKNCRLEDAKKEVVVVCNTFLHQAETAIPATQLARDLKLKVTTNVCGRFVWFRFENKKSAKKFRRKWRKIIKMNEFTELEEDV